MPRRKWMFYVYCILLIFPFAEHTFLAWAMLTESFLRKGGTEKNIFVFNYSLITNVHTTTEHNGGCKSVSLLHVIFASCLTRVFKEPLCGHKRKDFAVFSSAFLELSLTLPPSVLCVLNSVLRCTCCSDHYFQIRWLLSVTQNHLNSIDAYIQAHTDQHQPRLSG